MCRDSHMCCLSEMGFPASVGNTWACPLLLQLRTTAPRTWYKSANTSLNSSTSAWASRLENWVPRTTACDGATGNCWLSCLTVFSQRVLHWSAPKDCPHFRFMREVPRNRGRCFLCLLLMDFFTF